MENEQNSRSEQILELAALRRREKQVVDVEVEKTLLVVFALQESPSPARTAAETEQGFYGLPASAVESIVKVETITYVPGTPAWIPGVVNVRGEIESVLDLKAVLGLSQAEITPASRLLIAHNEDLRSGLLVDRMVDIVEVPQDDIHLPPTPQEGGKGAYIVGEAEYDGQTLVILNLSQVFLRALESGTI